MKDYWIVNYNYSNANSQISVAHIKNVYRNIYQYITNIEEKTNGDLVAKHGTGGHLLIKKGFWSADKNLAEKLAIKFL